jgi:hypothetical protein
VELDTGAELDATECAEVTGAELFAGMDLGSGCNRWMERSLDWRSEYGQGHAVQAGIVPASSADRMRPVIASGGAQHRAARATPACG